MALLSRVFMATCGPQAGEPGRCSDPSCFPTKRRDHIFSCVAERSPHTSESRRRRLGLLPGTEPLPCVADVLAHCQTSNTKRKHSVLFDVPSDQKLSLMGTDQMMQHTLSYTFSERGSTGYCMHQLMGSDLRPRDWEGWTRSCLYLGLIVSAMSLPTKYLQETIESHCTPRVTSGFFRRARPFS